MRVPDLEQMIEEHGPIIHPEFGTRHGYWVCHVCGEPSTPGDPYVMVLWWCYICSYSAHYHERCVEKKGRVIKA